MKIPLFGKDEGKEEQEKIDRIIMDSYEDQEQMLEPVKEEGAKSTATIAEASDEVLKALHMDLEKMRVRVEAITQGRTINEQRFTRMSEEIGDLRRRILDKEKEVGQLRLEAKKSSDLVSAVQPQKLMAEVKKGDAKTESVNAKQEANRALIDTVISEVKEVRKLISSFRGLDTIIKTYDEMKDDVRNLKKIEVDIKKQTGKVERIFVNVQEKYNEFLKHSTKISNLESSFHKIDKSFEEFKVVFDDTAKKKDFQEVNNKVESEVKKIDRYITDLKELNKEFAKVVDEAGKTESRQIYELESKLDNRLSDTEAYVRELNDKIERFIMVERGILRDGEVFYGKFEKTLKDAGTAKDMDPKTKKIWSILAARVTDYRSSLTQQLSLFDKIGR